MLVGMQTGSEKQLATRIRRVNRSEDYRKKEFKRQFSVAKSTGQIGIEATQSEGQYSIGRVNRPSEYGRKQVQQALHFLLKCSILGLLLWVYQTSIVCQVAKLSIGGPECQNIGVATAKVHLP